MRFLILVKNDGKIVSTYMGIKQVIKIAKKGIKFAPDSIAFVSNQKKWSPSLVVICPKIGFKLVQVRLFEHEE